MSALSSKFFYLPTARCALRLAFGLSTLFYSPALGWSQAYGGEQEEEPRKLEAFGIGDRADTGGGLPDRPNPEAVGTAGADSHSPTTESPGAGGAGAMSEVQDELGGSESGDQQSAVDDAFKGGEETDATSPDAQFPPTAPASPTPAPNRNEQNPKDCRSCRQRKQTLCVRECAAVPYQHQRDCRFRCINEYCPHKCQTPLSLEGDPSTCQSCKEEEFSLCAPLCTKGAPFAIAQCKTRCSEERCKRACSGKGR